MQRRLSVVAALALGLMLGGCETSDILDKVTDIDLFGVAKPKPLQGERKVVFPEGVPGVSKGVPPEMVKGYQPPPAPEPAPPPPVKQAKPKPKKKPPQQAQPAPAAPQPQPQQAAPWPAQQQTAPWPAPVPQQTTPWPAPAQQASPWPTTTAPKQ